MPYAWRSCAGFQPHGAHGQRVRKPPPRVGKPFAWRSFHEVEHGGALRNPGEGGELSGPTAAGVAAAARVVAAAADLLQFVAALPTRAGCSNMLAEPADAVDERTQIGRDRRLTGGDTSGALGRGDLVEPGAEGGLHLRHRARGRHREPVGRSTSPTCRPVRWSQAVTLATSAALGAKRARNWVGVRYAPCSANWAR